MGRGREAIHRGNGKRMHCLPEAIACSPRVPPSMGNPDRCPTGPGQSDWTALN